jgi:predicted outer membrane repeat protein
MIWFLALLISSSAFAAVHHVPQDYATIQAAIDAAQDSDTVILAPQTYTGLGNRNISFKGKKITVSSTDPQDAQVVAGTVIDCEGAARGFAFSMSEGADSKLMGVTIKNGYSFLGGAIYCYNNSSPLISNCVIVNNSGGFGGAITCANPGSNPSIVNCQIKANSALVGGGGIYCNGASPTIQGCIISGNYAMQGGGVYSHNPGSPALVNSTVAANNASQRAGGLYCYGSSNLATTNTILWQDAAQYGAELLVANIGAATSVAVSYCDVENSGESVIAESGCTVTWGAGNIGLDPCFVQIGYALDGKISAAGDYHLLSDSPCIDSGDPAFSAGAGEVDIDGDNRVSGGQVDIGADEREAAVLAANLDAKPENLNLGSNAPKINCIVTLPDGYDVGSIVLTTLRLNGDIRTVAVAVETDLQQVIAKFARADVEALIAPDQTSLSLQITGKLIDGTTFEGNDTVSISRPGGNNGNGNGNANGNGKAKGKG